MFRQWIIFCAIELMCGETRAERELQNICILKTQGDKVLDYSGGKGIETVKHMWKHFLKVYF